MWNARKWLLKGINQNGLSNENPLREFIKKPSIRANRMRVVKILYNMANIAKNQQERNTDAPNEESLNPDRRILLSVDCDLIENFQSSNAELTRLEAEYNDLVKQMSDVAKRLSVCYKYQTLLLSRMVDKPASERILHKNSAEDDYANFNQSPAA